MPSKLAKKVPHSREEYSQIDPQLKGKNGLDKGYQSCSESNHAICQVVAEVPFKKTQYHDPWTYVWCEHPPHEEHHPCYCTVLEQSNGTTELLVEGQYVDWKDFDLNKFAARLSSIKSVLNTTNATNYILQYKCMLNWKACSAGILPGLSAWVSAHI